MPLSPTSPATTQATSPEEIEALRGQYHRQVDQLTKLDDSLDKEIVRLNAQAAQAPGQAGEIEGLIEEIKSEEKIADNLRNQLERARVELDAASRISPYQNAE